MLFCTLYSNITKGAHPFFHHSLVITPLKLRSRIFIYIGFVCPSNCPSVCRSIGIGFVDCRCEKNLTSKLCGFGRGPG